MKKTISILLSLILILSLFTIISVPASAWTTTTVGYLDLEGNGQTVQMVRQYNGETYLDGSMYAVTGSWTINSRIICTGNISFGLANDVTLSALKGITVAQGSSLTIWQAPPEEGAEPGKLIISEPEDNYAGIGSEPQGAGGTVTINGGTVTVTGGANAAGIGGADSTVTINRGTVTVTGGANAAGIGGTNSTVTVNGGAVTAIGGSQGTGIVGDTIALNNEEIPYGEISITSDRYSGTVTLGDSFADGNGSCFPSGPVSDNSALAGKTLVPPFFTVTWKNENGSVLETDEKVPYGSTPTFDSARPTKYSDNDYSYNFAGWTPEVTSVDRDVVYTAKYTAVPWTIPYIDENGEEQVLTPDDYTEISSSTSSGWLAESSFSEGWNVVRENVTCSKRWSVSGSVDLLICSGTTFYVPEGISVTEGSSLTIWQQNEDGALEPGKLIIDSVDDYRAGIGGRANNSCGTVIINGGIVTVKGGKYSAGIGGATYIKNYSSGSGIGPGVGPGVGPIGDSDDDPVETSGGNITINGGTVTATGGEEAAGIGGGSWGTAGEITISGGTVTANGFTGIGSGKNTSGGSATLKWTEDSNDTMSVYASGCNVTVTLENTFKDSDGVLYEVGAVDGDTIAGKTLTPAFCTVTWKDHDGTVLGTDDVDVGILPAYGGTTPVRPSDDNYTYTFGGWTPEVSEAFEDATYTATYTATSEPVDGCFSGHSLTLDGDIGINFYVTFTDAQLPHGAVVDFAWTVEGVEKTGSVTLTASDLTANGYKATCPVAVAEMTCDVNATLTIGGVLYDTDVYSVKDYADTILSDDYKTKYLAGDHTEDEYNKLATLVKAMLIYGAKAQIWFDRNLDDLADAGLIYTLTEVTPEMISPSARDMESGLDAYGLKYEGTTIVYLSKTSLRHYYTITDQAKFDLVKDSIMFDAEPVDYHTKDGKIYFEVSNIGAADLDTPYPLQIGTNNYSYTVLDYVRECLKAKYTPHQTWVLVCATYWYNQAANDYFGR